MRWRIDILALVVLGGCSTGPLSAPDISTGWTTLQGQAVWMPQGGDGIAGELLVATNASGDFVVEFAKPPIAIAQAQRSGGRWHVEFPPQNKSFGGRGRGPSRILWVQLPSALVGGSREWALTTNQNGWRITNRHGESLEGYLTP